MKTVVITGASSGIGLATAQRFASENWRVVLLARRKQLLEEIASSLPNGCGARHLVVAGDYSQPSTADLLHKTLDDAGVEAVNAMVNCAAIIGSAPAIESPLDQWRIPLDTILGGAITITRAVVPRMTSGGRIVHVTSIHGERAEMNSSSYATAKAAINQYSRCLALELADRGILVNAVAPGFVNTPMSVASTSDGSNELESDWFKADYVEGRHLPLRRPGRPEEIAGVIWFLCGPDASYITGQCITVDGGLTITF